MNTKFLDIRYCDYFNMKLWGKKKKKKRNHIFKMSKNTATKCNVQTSFGF